MKQCPKCERIYSDESLRYCKDDGATLTQIFNPQGTLSLSSVAVDTASKRLTTRRRPYFYVAMAALIIGVAIGIITKSYLQGSDKVKSESQGQRGIEFVTKNDLAAALRASKKRIKAAGYVLQDVDADLIKDRAEQSSDFEATIVLADPLGVGESKSVICQRQRDENPRERSFDDYAAIIGKIQDFSSTTKTGNLIGKRLTLGVVDLYPTMAVFMVDDDLYAYFYTYGAASDSGPVIKFKDYTHTRDKQGQYFESHLNRITDRNSGNGVTKFLTDSDFKIYESADKNHPCLKGSPVAGK